MKHQPEQLPIFTGPDMATPAAANDHPHLSALEIEAWYVNPILCRYWRQATTRQDWRKLCDWLDVLATNAGLYKSPTLLDEYHLLLLVALHYRKQAPQAWTGKGGAL